MGGGGGIELLPGNASCWGPVRWALRSQLPAALAAGLDALLGRAVRLSPQVAALGRREHAIGPLTLTTNRIRGGTVHCAHIRQQSRHDT
eukprot:gene5849-11802_t